MRVKICGITSPDDAALTAAAGADAIGLNFVAGPRQITLEAAPEILAAVPPLVTPVALVTLQEDGDLPGDLLELLAMHWVSHVQVYGQVTPQAVVRLIRDGFRPLVVGHVRDRSFAEPVSRLVAACGAHGPAGVVLDAFDSRRAGGTGQSFPWDWLAEAREAGELDTWPPIILAGGLCPENVAEAVARTRPWGVDVASGVESEPGRKDPDKIAQFVLAARSAANA